MHVGVALGHSKKEQNQLGSSSSSYEENKPNILGTGRSEAPCLFSAKIKPGISTKQTNKQYVSQNKNLGSFFFSIHVWKLLTSKKVFY